MVYIWTDGSCSPNPGDGGWAAILKYKNKKKEIYGGEEDTTNNRMELLSAIKGLCLLKRKCNVILYTDSKYLKNGVSNWIQKWKKSNWKTSQKKDVKNKDLWIELDRLNNLHEINWKWVKGHDGHYMNERADNLANLGRKNKNWK